MEPINSTRSRTEIPYGRGRCVGSVMVCARTPSETFLSFAAFPHPKRKISEGDFAWVDPGEISASTGDF